MSSKIVMSVDIVLSCDPLCPRNSLVWLAKAVTLSVLKAGLTEPS